MSQRKVFVRDATGLVRELSFLDQFFISAGIIIAMNGYVGTQLFAPFYFPGANLILVGLLGCIPALAMAYIYGKLSAVISRSGGDYVWSTRIVGPLFGAVQFTFLFAVTVTFVVFCVWSQFTFALAPAAFALGVLWSNSSLTSLAVAFNSAGLGYPLSVVLLLVYLAASLLGLRVCRSLFRVVVPIYFLSNAVFIIMLFSINTSTIAGLFDHAMSFAGYNATYTGLAQQAAAAGYTGTQFNLGNTILAAIPWGFLPFTGFNYGAYLAGETKNVKSSIIKALTLAVVISIVLIAIMGIMTYVDFGADFVNASSYIQATNPSAFPVLPLATTLISLTNPVVAVLIGIGMFAGWITAAVGYIVTLARMVFAASFDSMLPRRFADVSDRWHSPHWAVALVGIASFIYLTVYWNYGWAATLLNTSIVLPIGYGLPLVAAAVFPYMKRDMYQRLFGSMKGALTFTVIALIGAAAFVFYGFAETFPISSGMFLGTNLALAYEVVLAMLIIGLVIYFTAKLRLSREGIPLASVFQEIPPE